MATSDINQQSNYRKDCGPLKDETVMQNSKLKSTYEEPKGQNNVNMSIPIASSMYVYEAFHHGQKGMNKSDVVFAIVTIILVIMQVSVALINMWIRQQNAYFEKYNSDGLKDFRLCCPYQIKRKRNGNNSISWSDLTATVQNSTETVEKDSYCCPLTCTTRALSASDDDRIQKYEWLAREMKRHDFMNIEKETKLKNLLSQRVPISSHTDEDSRENEAMDHTQKIARLKQSVLDYEIKKKQFEDIEKDIDSIKQKTIMKRNTCLRNWNDYMYYLYMLLYLFLTGLKTFGSDSAGANESNVFSNNSAPIN